MNVADTPDGFTVVTHVILLRPGPREVYLLQRRDENGALHGRLVPPGGHLRAGETLWDAARREVLEETGAKLPADPDAPGNGLLAMFTWHGDAVARPGVNVVFGATRWQGQPSRKEPERFSAAGFHAVDTLPGTLLPWLGDAIELALSRPSAPAQRAYRWD